jgi:hypothetical protein
MGNQKMRGMEKWSQKIRTEESINQESISDPEAILEIQEMNSLTIISSKVKQKYKPQQLQSIMILSKKIDENSEEYSIKETTKEKKYEIEMIPREKEPLISQKTEHFNITSLKRKAKPRNQIQELDGLEIINRRRRNIEKEDTRLKRKTLLIPQNIDKISIQSLIPKKEYKNVVQELDGIEIIKSMKEAPIPQCVDELVIPREYDMLLVKPTWNSLQIQGSGLNLLAIPRDIGLENQEVDEFEILGMEKPELYIESIEPISYDKPNVLQKIQVLIPIPDNNIQKQENWSIKGKQKPKVIPNKLMKNDRFRIYGLEKEEKKVVPNKVMKNDRFRIYGLEKEEKKVEPNKVMKNDRFRIYGLEKEEKVVEPNRVMKNDRFRIYGLEKEEKVVEPNRIMKSDRFRIYGLEKEEKIVEPNKVMKNDRFRINGIPKVEKVVEPNKVMKNDRFRIYGLEKEEKKNRTK